jgi:alanine racemase
MQKIVVEINVKAIEDNARKLKARTGKRLCAVVKADGYGHGAEETVCALSGVADCFAVAIIDEGINIKAAACGKDILVLTPPMDEADAERILQNGFVACVPDLVTAKLLVKVGARLQKLPRLHIKVNTGMNRYGASLQLLGKICKYLKMHGVAPEGLFSHLYLHQSKTAHAQRQIFLRAQRVCRRYFSSFISHLSATYGATLGQDFAFDMVRIGLGVYGYLPDDTPNKEKLEKDLGLKKAMRVRARVVCSRKYSGGGLGYGNGTKSERRQAKEQGISVLRVGYGDGFFWSNPSGIYGGEKQLGALCMDARLCIGQMRRAKWLDVMTDAYLAAKIAGTISYEILCCVGKRGEKRYIYQ